MDASRTRWLQQNYADCGTQQFANISGSNEIFKIHTDANSFQLGAVIGHKDKPIDFYSRRLTDSQQRYKVTYKELLCIVETLKEFITTLLGQKLRIYTDYKNLTCKLC